MLAEELVLRLRADITDLEKSLVKAKSTVEHFSTASKTNLEQASTTSRDAVAKTSSAIRDFHITTNKSLSSIVGYIKGSFIPHFIAIATAGVGIKEAITTITEYEKTWKALAILTQHSVPLFQEIKNIVSVHGGGLFSELDVARATKYALSVGLNIDQTKALLPLIRDTAAAYGEDLTLSLTAVIRAMKFGEAELAERIGLTLRENAILDTTIRLYGKRLSQLSAEQKEYAVLIAAMEQMQKFRGAETAMMETTVGMISRLRKDWENFIIQAQDGVRPAIASVVEILRSLIIAISSIFPILSVLGKSLSALTTGIFPGLNAVLSIFGLTLTKIISTAEGLVRVLLESGTVLKKFISWIWATITFSKEANAKFKEFELAVADYIASLHTFGATNKKTFEGFFDDIVALMHTSKKSGEEAVAGMSKSFKDVEKDMTHWANEAKKIPNVVKKVSEQTKDETQKRAEEIFSIEKKQIEHTVGIEWEGISRKIELWKKVLEKYKKNQSIKKMIIDEIATLESERLKNQFEKEIEYHTKSLKLGEISLEEFIGNLEKMKEQYKTKPVAIAAIDEIILEKKREVSAKEINLQQKTLEKIFDEEKKWVDAQTELQWGGHEIRLKMLEDLKTKYKDHTKMKELIENEITLMVNTHSRERFSQELKTYQNLFDLRKIDLNEFLSIMERMKTEYADKAGAILAIEESILAAKSEQRQRDLELGREHLQKSLGLIREYGDFKRELEKHYLTVAEEDTLAFYTRQYEQKEIEYEEYVAHLARLAEAAFHNAEEIKSITDALVAAKTAKYYQLFTTIQDYITKMTEAFMKSFETTLEAEKNFLKAFESGFRSAIRTCLEMLLAELLAEAIANQAKAMIRALAMPFPANIFAIAKAIASIAAIAAILAGARAAIGALIPKAQKGGMVVKEGIAHLHPAEIITPVRKLPFSTINININLDAEVYHPIDWEIASRSLSQKIVRELKFAGVTI